MLRCCCICCTEGIRSSRLLCLWLKELISFKVSDICRNRRTGDSVICRSCCHGKPIWFFEKKKTNKQQKTFISVNNKKVMKGTKQNMYILTKELRSIFDVFELRKQKPKNKNKKLGSFGFLVWVWFWVWVLP